MKPNRSCVPIMILLLLAGCQHGKVVDLTTRYMIDDLDSILRFVPSLEGQEYAMIELSKRGQLEVLSRMSKCRTFWKPAILDDATALSGRMVCRFYRDGQPIGPWISRCGAPPHATPSTWFAVAQNDGFSIEWYYESFSEICLSKRYIQSVKDYHPLPEERVPSDLLVHSNTYVTLLEKAERLSQMMEHLDDLLQILPTNENFLLTEKKTRYAVLCGLLILKQHLYHHYDVLSRTAEFPQEEFDSLCDEMTKESIGLQEIDQNSLLNIVQSLPNLQNVCKDVFQQYRQQIERMEKSGEGVH